MTNMFDDTGRNIPVTAIEVEPAVVLQIKTMENDGYKAVQLGSFDKSEKNTNQAEQGHFKAVGANPKSYVIEYRDFPVEGLEPGDELNIDDVLAEAQEIDVVGISKGRGFTGVMRRHNFGGVGDATHGQHTTPRASGSIGGASDPSRVFKGKKMAGRSGGQRSKVKNLKVQKILSDSNIILVSGSIPGPNGGYVEIQTS